MSVLLFPPAHLDRPAWLTTLGAVAVAELASELLDEPATIKWPNDVRVRGKKIAGILVERAFGAGTVIGLGLNVNLDVSLLPDEFRANATSLQALQGTALDRSEIARALILRLDAHYARGLDEGPQALSSAWQAMFEPLGRDVQVQTCNGPITGWLAAADLITGLLLETPDSPPMRIALEEVAAIAILERSADAF